MTFEQYLREKHVEENPHLLDDMIPDAFNDWLRGLDPQEIIDWAEEWKKL